MPQNILCSKQKYKSILLVSVLSTQIDKHSFSEVFVFQTKVTMPAFKIKVKWGKEVFSDVEVGFLIERLFIMFASKVNTDEEPMVFKAQLMALTGVQVH